MNFSVNLFASLPELFYDIGCMSLLKTSNYLKWLNEDKQIATVGGNKFTTHSQIFTCFFDHFL